MSDAPLHRGAVHEAGHAVMARLLGGGIRSIKVDLTDPHGDAHTDLIRTEETLAPKNRMLISAASRACLLTFGCDVLHDGELWKDEGVIDTIAHELFPDDEAQQERCKERWTQEVERWFDQPNVRAAVVELVDALMREGQINGTEAEAIIDRHIA